MALTITITDPKLIELIQKKAEEAGVSQSEAAQRVLEEHADETPTPAHEPGALAMTQEQREQRAVKVLEIVTRMQSRMDPTMSRTDYDDWLYDENGLPH